jgi:hypothetical protein
MSRASGAGWTLRFIATLKLLKGLLLLAVAVGALRLLHRDVADVAATWIDQLHLDPEAVLATLCWSGWLASTTGRLGRVPVAGVPGEMVSRADVTPRRWVQNSGVESVHKCGGRYL